MHYLHYKNILTIYSLLLIFNNVKIAIYLPICVLVFFFILLFKKMHYLHYKNILTIYFLLLIFNNVKIAILEREKLFCNPALTTLGWWKRLDWR